MIQEIIRIDLNGVNCYLLKQNNNFVLFDTGGHMNMDKTFDNRRNALISELDKAGCTPDNLKLIILTHGDNDHTANADFLRNKYHAKIAMHKADLELVENPTLEKVIANFRFKSLLYNIVSLFIKKLIYKITEKNLHDFDSFRPDIFLEDGFQLSEFGFDAKILHIPGHTLGSIAILTANDNLISGDTFSNMKKPGAAPNAIDFKQLSNSVKKLVSMNIQMVYPGHGAPFTMTHYLKGGKQ